MGTGDLGRGPANDQSLHGYKLVIGSIQSQRGEYWSSLEISFPLQRDVKWRSLCIIYSKYNIYILYTIDRYIHICIQYV